MTQWAANQLINPPKNPSLICCTHRTGAGKSAGSCARIVRSACGPPVDAPMATMRGRAGGGGRGAGLERREARYNFLSPGERYHARDDFDFADQLLGHTLFIRCQPAAGLGEYVDGPRLQQSEHVVGVLRMHRSTDDENGSWEALH